MSSTNTAYALPTDTFFANVDRISGFSDMASILVFTLDLLQAASSVGVTNDA